MAPIPRQNVHATFGPGRAVGRFVLVESAGGWWRALGAAAIALHLAGL